MTTFVGTQDDFSAAMQELVELEYDAIEAYQAAVNRLTNQLFKAQLASFLEDHQKHVRELTEIMLTHNVKTPTGPSLTKQWLAKGKVVLANIVGDSAILSAMISNEEDTNKAYENMLRHPKKWPDVEDILQRGLTDERRHKANLEQAVHNDRDERHDL